ncbi:MAG: threonine synthase [Saprospiraceae bacterium]
MKNRYTHLECHECGKKYDKNKIQTFCSDDNQPLVARYDLSKSTPKETLNDRTDMWRYSALLPVEDHSNQLQLGEGGTPLIPLLKLGKKYNSDHLLLKDEGFNPSGSFKARGISMAISKAKELGIKATSIPTAGNAGSALSAYCAKADIDAHIFMPEATPKVFKVDCNVMGAKVTTVPGSISDAGAMMRAKNDGSWFDITTLKEPFRLEGKKTMGYEIAEQMGWKVPDVCIYPTGGGTGLIGIWKAFQEMKEMGWLHSVNTRMVVVQTAGCNPIVEAWKKGKMDAAPFENPEETIANGLRVPHAFGHKLILKTLKESNGCALDVTEKEMLDGLSEFAMSEGIFLAPEGAAVWEAYKKLRASDWIKSHESVVLLNTGSAYK